MKLLRRVEDTGFAGPGAQIGGYRRPLLEPHAAVLGALVAAKPDITLAELRETALAARGIVVKALSTIDDALRRLQLRREKET